jgi:succinate dehydrogenase / fumarate reductase cytochrome b subunit
LAGVSPESEAPAPARGLARRVFELTSVVPLSVWVVLHVVTYARVATRAPAFPGAEHRIPVLLLAEVVLVFLPLLYHAAYGGALMLSGKRASSEPPSERALELTERATGVFLLVALTLHCYRFRLPVLLGHRYSEHAPQALFAELSRTSFGVPFVAALELGLVFAAAFHTAYGLYKLALRYAPRGAERERWFRLLATGFGALVSVVGAYAIIRIATGG